MTTTTATGSVLTPIAATAATTDSIGTDAAVTTFVSLTSISHGTTVNPTMPQAAKSSPVGSERCTSSDDEISLDVDGEDAAGRPVPCRRIDIGAVAQLDSTVFLHTYHLAAVVAVVSVAVPEGVFEFQGSPFAGENPVVFKPTDHTRTLTLMNDHRRADWEVAADIR
tara:strand:+ start:208 stop:708 length:501 start_codon:yes stop_codon:yes gene_type:complete